MAGKGSKQRPLSVSKEQFDQNWESIFRNNKEDELKEIYKHFKDGYFKGIAVGEGWYKLVLQCHNELKELDPDYDIYQIKEKFGQLRYYFTTNKGEDIFEKMNKIALKYENQSCETCDICGKKGKRVINNGRIMTRCEEHANDN